MNDPETASDNRSPDVLMFLAVPIAASLLGGAWSGIDAQAPTGLWTWRQMLLAAFLPGYFILLGWRLWVHRTDRQRVRFLLGTASFIAPLLLLALAIGFMAMTDSWI